MRRLGSSLENHPPVESRQPSLRIGLSLLLTALLAMAGCAKHYVNEPLDELDRSTGYRYRNLESPLNSEKMLVILTFSGGGTRSAALAYGVLEELARTELVVDEKKKRLLDEIDIISSVSGGSFTAAYFALFGDRIFEDFEEKFLKKDIQSKLTGKMFSPWVWPRLWSPQYNRDDMATDLYNKLIFEDKTFADLIQKDRPPYIVINASDVALGARFEFTQAQFDLICSDLSGFPVARAVAASSAVPGAFGTVKLNNHSKHCGGATPPWVEDTLADPDATLRMRNNASEARSYTEAKKKYVHLVDGGITDNIGVRSILDLMLQQQVAQDQSLIETMDKVERVVLVVVDAHVEKNPGFSFKESIGFFKLLGAAVSIPMNRYSYESLELFQESILRRAERIEEDRALKAEQAGKQPLAFEVYLIYLQFNHLPDEEDAKFFSTMPTSFRLKPAWVDRLRAMAADSLAGSTPYKRLLQDTNATVQPRPDTPAEPETQ